MRKVGVGQSKTVSNRINSTKLYLQLTLAIFMSKAKA